MEFITDNEKNAIINAMVAAMKKYPDSTDCLDRSCLIQDLTGFGEVLTFSRDGVSILETEDMERLVTFTRKFTIPTRADYKGDVKRIYHTVFVYKERVFCFELGNDVSLGEYKAALKKLNGVFIRVKQEHREKSNDTAA